MEKKHFLYVACFFGLHALLLVRPFVFKVYTAASMETARSLHVLEPSQTIVWSALHLSGQTLTHSVFRYISIKLGYNYDSSYVCVSSFVYNLGQNPPINRFFTLKLYK